MPRGLQPETFCALAAALLVSGQAQAAIFTWNNTGTDVNTSTSWSSSTSGGVATGGTLVFNAAATTQPNLSSALSLASIYFSTAAASGYDLTSSSGNTVALTLTGTGIGSTSAIRSANTSGANTIDAALVLGAAAGTTQTFQQTSGGTLVINGVISGGASTSVLSLNSSNASGLIKLTGNNTFTSNVEIIATNSVVSVSSIGNVGASSNLGAGSTIIITGGASGGGTLKYTGAGESASKVISLNNSTGGTIDTSAATGALILTGDLIAPASGAKTLTLTGGATNSEFQGKISDGAGGGTTAVKISAGTWILSGANTYSGGLTLVAGATLGIKNAAALGTGALAITGGTFDNLAGSALTLSTNNAISISGSVAFAGSSNLNLGTGAVAMNNLTLTVSASSLTVGGNISETASGKTLSKAGNGTLVLSGSNAYTGKTTISAGTLQFAKQTSLYSGSSALWTSSKIEVDSGATLAVNVGGSGEFTSADLDTLKALGTSASGFSNGSILGIDTTNASGGNFTYASNITNAYSGANALGITKLGSNTLTLTGSNSYTGATTVAGGTLAVNGWIGASSAVYVNSGATLSGSGTVSGAVTTTSATISGNGSGLHLGATTLNGSSTLSGYNIASGVTIASGSTTLTGTTQSSSALTVSVGATLNNNGKVDGSVNVNGGLMKGTGEVTGNLALTSGTLAPGNSAGITTVDGNFSMDSASKLVAEVSGLVAGTSYDQVKVSGNVSLAGTLDLTTLGGLTMGSEVILINNTGTGTTKGYFASIITNGSTYTLTSNSDYKFTVGSTEYLLSFTSNVGSDSQFNDVTLTVVPEPSAWAMFAGGLGLLVCGQRLRRRCLAR